MALTQITTDGIKDGTITGTDLATNVDLVDNQKLRLGTGNDLQIYHDGSKNYIRGATASNIDIRTAADFFITHADTDGSNAENCIVVRGDGAVELYHNNSKKFETTSGGVQVTDNLNMSGGHIFLADNYKLNVGTGDDLQIFHSGVNSVIDNNTGGLYIRNNVASDVGGDIFIQAKSGENSAKFIHDGSVELYHNNSKKFETTSTGAKISSTAAALRLHSTTDQQTAVIEMTSSADQSQMGSIKYNHSNSSIVSGYLEAFLIDGTETNLAVKVDGAIKIPDSGTKGAKLLIGAGDDLQIYHDGTHSKLVNSTGDLHLASNNAVKILGGSDLAEVQAVFNNDGSVELYHDNTKKFETTSSGTSVTANSDIRFTNGGWTGNSGSTPKIQAHSNRLYIVGGTDGIRFREDGTDRWDIEGGGHFIPKIDSTYDIGSNGTRVRNGYFDTLYGDGSNLTGISSTNNFVSSASFNTGNGVLTLNRSGLGTVTVDLDGRFATGTIPTNNNQLSNGRGFVTANQSTTSFARTLENSRTGSAPNYALRAWVNFDGRGSISIRGNGNVSSISDFGTGNYRVNFSTSMADGNYSTTTLGGYDQTGGTAPFIIFSNGGFDGSPLQYNSSGVRCGSTYADFRYATLMFAR